MSSLLSGAIISACMSVATGQYNTACDKALEAEMKQSGVEQKEGNGEDQLTKITKKAVKNNYGETGEAALGLTIFSIKSYTEKKVSFPLKNTGICDTISPTITKDSASINFDWRW